MYHWLGPQTRGFAEEFRTRVAQPHKRISKPSVPSRIRGMPRQGRQRLDVRRVGKEIERAQAIQAVSGVEQPAGIPGERRWIARDVDDAIRRQPNDGFGRLSRKSRPRRIEKKR